MNVRTWVLGVCLPNAIGLGILAAVILPPGAHLGADRLVAGFMAEAITAISLSLLATRMGR